MIEHAIWICGTCRLQSCVCDAEPKTGGIVMVPDGLTAGQIVQVMDAICKATEMERERCATVSQRERAAKPGGPAALSIDDPTSDSREGHPSAEDTQSSRLPSAWFR